MVDPLDYAPIIGILKEDARYFRADMGMPTHAKDLETAVQAIEDLIEAANKK